MLPSFFFTNNIGVVTSQLFEKEKKRKEKKKMGGMVRFFFKSHVLPTYPILPHHSFSHYLFISLTGHSFSSPFGLLLFLFFFFFFFFLFFFVFFFHKHTNTPSHSPSGTLHTTISTIIFLAWSLENP